MDPRHQETRQDTGYINLVKARVFTRRQTFTIISRFSLQTVARLNCAFLVPHQQFASSRQGISLGSKQLTYCANRYLPSSLAGLLPIQASPSK